MRRLKITGAFLFAAIAPALAADAVNLDAEPHSLIVTEGVEQSEIVVGAGETVNFCANGCFVTLPNGDRQALAGSETIEITEGRARIR